MTNNNSKKHTVRVSGKISTYLTFACSVNLGLISLNVIPSGKLNNLTQQPLSNLTSSSDLAALPLVSSSGFSFSVDSNLTNLLSFLTFLSVLLRLKYVSLLMKR